MCLLHCSRILRGISFGIESTSERPMSFFALLSSSPWDLFLEAVHIRSPESANGAPNDSILQAVDYPGYDDRLDPTFDPLRPSLKMIRVAFQ